MSLAWLAVWLESDFLTSVSWGHIAWTTDWWLTTENDLDLQHWKNRMHINIVLTEMWCNGNSDWENSFWLLKINFSNYLMCYWETRISKELIWQLYVFSLLPHVPGSTKTWRFSVPTEDQGFGRDLPPQRLQSILTDQPNVSQDLPLFWEFVN